MPLHPDASWRWRNVALAAAMFAAGAGVAIAVLRRPGATPDLPAAGVPDNRIDLRDAVTRSALGLVAARQLGDYPSIASGLFWRCDRTTVDTVAASIAYSISPLVSVEIRRGTGTEASALVWSEPHWPPAASGTELDKRRVDFPQPRAVADQEFAAIMAEFLALSAEGTPPIAWESGFDNSTALLEICRGGEYGLFIRDGYSDRPGQRMFTLARRVAAAAGVPGLPAP